MDIYRISEERFAAEKEYLGSDKEVNRTQPLVSVTVAAYQHAPYIRQCLDSILSQKTTFPFEIIVGEDGSTDGTGEICMEYAEKHPEKIRLYIRDRERSLLKTKDGQVIMPFNLKWTRKSARGTYIAICEGDDYWTDPYKLQKQTDFLNENEDYVLTVGGYWRLFEKTGEMHKVIKQVSPPDIGRDYGYTFTADMASKHWITKTLTLVYRNQKDLDKELYRYRFSRDVHLAYHLLKQGKGFYFTEIFGVYRIHDGGVYGSRSTVERALMRYHINRELYYKNRDKTSRVMYMVALTGMLRRYREEYQTLDEDLTRFRLIVKLVRLLRSPGECLAFINTLYRTLSK